MHLRQRGRALGRRRRPRRAAVARPVGGGVEPAGVAAEVVQIGLCGRRRARRRHRQRVDVDGAAVAGCAQQTDRVRPGAQGHGRGDGVPVVPAARGRQRQGLDVRAVDGQVDRARRRTPERTDVVRVPHADHGLAGGRAEHRPGCTAAALAEAGDEPGDALIGGVVGLDVRSAAQRSGAGVAHLVERARVLPLWADRVSVGEAHRGVVRPERPGAEPVVQRGLGCRDRQPVVRLADAIARHFESPVQRVHGRSVFEARGRRVLHPDQAVAEDLEARAAGDDRGPRSRLRGAEVDRSGKVHRRGRRGGLGLCGGRGRHGKRGNGDDGQDRCNPRTGAHFPTSTPAVRSRRAAYHSPGGLRTAGRGPRAASSRAATSTARPRPGTRRKRRDGARPSP